MQNIIAPIKSKHDDDQVNAGYLCSVHDNSSTSEHHKSRCTQIKYNIPM